MRGTSTVRGWRRWAWRGALALIGGLILGLVIAWLATNYIPTWYDPPQLSDDDLPRVRADLPATMQEFTDRLVVGGTFEFKLSAGQVNEWIAGRASIWPDAQGSLPEWLQDPVVAFEGGRLIVAARAQRSGWRAIVSAHVTVSVDGDDLVIRLVKTAVGALGTPMQPIVDALCRSVHELLDPSGDLPQYLRRLAEGLDRVKTDQTLRDGVHVENRFIWPNGERRFRITQIRAEHGWLTLFVEPL